MDLPIHLATGALVGNAILYAEQTTSHAKDFSQQQIKVGTACFLLGVLSHLFWDAVPHYDWLFYITILNHCPSGGTSRRLSRPSRSSCSPGT